MPEAPVEKKFEKEPIRVKKLYDNLYEISGTDNTLRSFLNSFNQCMEIPMRQEEIQNYLVSKIGQWNWGAVFRLEVKYTNEGTIKSLIASLNPGALSSAEKYGPELLQAVQTASGA